jgi:plastocyanin
MKTFVALLAALGLFFAACGDDSSSDDAADDTPAADSGSSDDAADDTPAASGGTAVTIADFAFDAPDSVAIGTTVEVSNTDGATHTFTSADGSFDTGNIAGGATATVTFDTAGTIDYFCSIHPSMTGSITVEG